MNKHEIDYKAIGSRIIDESRQIYEERLGAMLVDCSEDELKRTNQNPNKIK